MKKYCRIPWSLLFCALFFMPTKSAAQFEVFLDFLIYDYGFLFGFENEPGPDAVEFSAYPYEFDDRGLFLYPEEEGFRTSTNINFHFQNNEDNLTGGFLQVKFSPIPVLTLDVNHLQLFESIRNQEDGRYSFTNFSGQWNRIRSTRFHLWWDMGVTRAGGRSQEVEWGPSLGIGATFYIKKPISLYTDFKWAYFFDNLNSTGFYEVRLQAHARQFKIYAGLQFVDGDFNWASWTFGTGVYF